MPTYAKILKWLAAASFVVLLLAVLGPNGVFAPTYTGPINPSEISPYGRHGYSFPVKIPSIMGLSVTPDDTSPPPASNLRVYEDGKLLGPAHSIHQEVSDLGEGRFSYWRVPGQNILVFSASDNSDPRTNGKTYAIRGIYTTPGFVLVLLLLPLVVFILQRFIISPNWLPAFQAATITAVCLVWINTLGGFVAYSPDSATYYNWSTLVPLGYPIFLAAIGNLAAVPLVQMLLLGGAAFFLCLATNQISVGAGLATLLAFICSTPIFLGAFALLSEALFAPLLLVNLGAAIFAITQPGKKSWPVLLAASAAAIMFVRPAGYYAPIGILFLLVAFRSQRRFLARWSLVPLLIFVALTFTANLAVRGSTTQSQIGRVLFPHVAFFFDPSFASDQDREIAEIFDRTLASHRARYREQVTLLERFLFSMRDYNARLSDMEKALYEKVSVGSETYAGYMRRLDQTYLRLFLQTVIHRPLAYLGTICEQLYGAWTQAILVNSPIDGLIAWEADQLDWRTKHVAQNQVPLSKDALVPNLDRFAGLGRSIVLTQDEALLRIESQRWLIYLAGVLSLIAIPGVFFLPSSPRPLVLGYCGVMIHGAVLLACATTVFIPRYAIPVEPVLLLFGGLAIESVLMCARRLLERTFRSGSPAVEPT